VLRLDGERRRKREQQGRDDAFQSHGTPTSGAPPDSAPAPRRPVRARGVLAAAIPLVLAVLSYAECSVLDANVLVPKFGVRADEARHEVSASGVLEYVD
jgi:hypothetical protein